MIDAAQEAQAFVKDQIRQDLEQNRMLTLALVRLVEIIGEAASKITPEFRGKYPDIPWSEIVGMRNRLIHAYFEIDLDQVWSTITEEIPP
jgi:uncharacterized protein with HEPN domain